MAALIVTLALCTLGAVLLIRRYDLYDKEPLWAMAIAVFLGAIGMYFIALPQEWLGELIGTSPLRFALIAATTEESLKLGIVVLLAIVLRQAFNDPVDGVIYGSLVGLGCALEESVAYFIDPVARPWAAPQEVIRVMGHLIFGGLSGFGVGLLRARSVPRRRARALSVIGVGVAIALHGLWDVQAYGTFGRHAPELFDRIAQVTLMLCGFVAYAVVLRIAWGEAQRVFEGRHWRRLLRGTPIRRVKAESSDASRG